LLGREGTQAPLAIAAAAVDRAQPG
jgi:hypothetical protein